MNEQARICQIALSVVDLPQSVQFYESLFSLTPSGGTDQFKGELASAVQGLTDVASEVSWMIDDRDFFQLELFKFEQPAPQEYAQQRSPEDIGYSRIAFDVADIEQVSQSVESRGGSIITPISLHNGNRQFLCKDPNAILIQVNEAELPSGVLARLSGIAASVPSLVIAKQDFVTTMGFSVTDKALVADKLMDGDDTEKQSLLLDGKTIWVELNEYQRPEPRPWPQDYQLCDYGILNIAVGYHNAAPFQVLYNRCINAGFRANSEPRQLPGSDGVTYVYDRQGFSIEMFCLHSDYDAAYGFKPA